MKKLLLILILILLTYVLVGYCATYTSQYPTHDDDHVKATTKISNDGWPYFATNPAKSLIGTWFDNSWICENGVFTNQRFHIDLSSGKVIKRIYYENYHHVGTDFEQGAKNFTFWGSNEATAFAELTYATDTDWTELTVATNVMLEHVGLNQADPKYIVVTNSTAYQYYAFKFADNYSGSNFIGVRRIELQTKDEEEANAIWFGMPF